MLAQLQAEESRTAGREDDPHGYADDPVGYAENILGITTLTGDQEQILRHLLLAPRRVLVPSGHTTGKTFLAGVAINWWYDSFNPGCVFTIGPRFESLADTIWGEVRRQRAMARVPLPDDFIGPQAPHMRSATDHFAKAFTATKDASLTGRHFPNMLFCIEEAIGVDPIWWEVIMTMFDPSLGHAQLVIFNPTDTTSQAYLEDQRVTDAQGNPRWHRFRLDSTRHPNVLSQLRGGPKIIPHAVSLETIEQAVRDECEPLLPGDEPRAGDLEWPPSDVTGRPGKWYRPGPVFQARWLARWPDAGAGVWSPALWDACQFPRERIPAFPLDRLPQLGCDCSTGKGDDYFALHGRWGAVSIYHKTSNTMDPAAICGAIKSACRSLADLASGLRPRGAEPVAPEQVPVAVDDDGVGAAVVSFLRAGGFNAHPVGAAALANDPERYPNKRSELWFHGAELAKAGRACLSLLEAADLARLRQQLLAPQWKLDAQGRRVVEPKDKTKEKIGRSPDDADALNLSLYELPAVAYEAHGVARGGQDAPEVRGPREVAAAVEAGPQDPRAGGHAERRREREEQDWRSHRGGRQHFGYR